MSTGLITARTALPWQYHDGGRAAAGFRGDTGDCVPRAIAIATGMDYRRVYDDMAANTKTWLATSRARRRYNRTGRLRSSSPRSGVFRDVYHPYITGVLGWRWTPTMSIGAGTTVHLAVGELPNGPLIAKVSRHLCAVIDGVVYDTYDPTRDGTRCVYGYYQPAA